LAWRVWLHLRVSTRRRCAASSSRTFMGPPLKDRYGEPERGE
jgi:hypothetical protein